MEESNFFREEAEFLHPVAQSVACEVQELRGPGLVAPGHVEGLADKLFFDLLDVDAAGRYLYVYVAYVMGHDFS